VTFPILADDQEGGTGRRPALSLLMIGQQLFGCPKYYRENSVAVGDKETPIRTR
jgi:hypothetical protein